MSWEKVTPDYTILKMETLPVTGGDTLFASGYDVYDKLSQVWKTLAESVTATYSEPCIEKAAQGGGFQLFAGTRGSPENNDLSLQAVHPVYF